MAIPNGVIFIWSGTNASIPAGWSRVTDLDDRFPKGDATPNVIGGSATHTHTGTSHNHSVSAHTHTITLGPASGGGVSTGTTIDSGLVIPHTHPATTSAGVTVTENNAVSVTYSSFSNNPPFYSVIYITPATSAGGIPDLGLGLSDDTSFVDNSGKYNGYYKCDGNNSTPNLAYKYLLGASALANAGTTGGSLTNSHNLTHTHTVKHTHSAVTVPASSSTRVDSTAAAIKNEVAWTHTHSVSLNEHTASFNDNPSTTTPESVEPAYKALLAVQNRSGTIYTPVGIIGLWLGSVASIPTNFEVVTAMQNYHLKIGGIVGDIGVTGGSNTHIHASSSHTHAGISHNHTANGAGHINEDSSRFSGATAATADSVHATTVSSVNIEMASANTTADSSSNEPSFRTVAFIKYKGETGGGFLFNLLR